MCAVLCAVCAGLSAAAPEPSAVPADCFSLLAAGSSPPQAPAEAQRVPSGTRARHPLDPDAAKRFGRPLEEAEIQQLVSALEPLKEGRPLRVKGLDKTSALSPVRFAVILSDVRALLADIHAREMLKLLPQAEGMPPQTRQWMEKSLGAMRGCASARFEGRGGAPAFARSLALVEKNRSRLEPLVLEAFAGAGTRGLPPPGPPRNPR